MPSDIDAIIADVKAKAAKATPYRFIYIAANHAETLADEVVRLRKENESLGLALKISQELFDAIRESESKLKTRLIEGTNA